MYAPTLVFCIETHFPHIHHMFVSCIFIFLFIYLLIIYSGLFEYFYLVLAFPYYIYPHVLFFHSSISSCFFTSFEVIGIKFFSESLACFFIYSCPTTADISNISPIHLHVYFEAVNTAPTFVFSLVVYSLSLCKNLHY